MYHALKFPHIILMNPQQEVRTMCQIRLRKLLGISAVCFGAGILLSFILPGYFLAFIEAAVLIAAGVLLLGKHN